MPVRAHRRSDDGEAAIRMKAIKIIGWACLGLVIGSRLTLAGGLTWRNHRDEVGALAISVLGMLILLNRSMVGPRSRVSGCDRTTSRERDIEATR